MKALPDSLLEQLEPLREHLAADQGRASKGGLRELGRPARVFISSSPEDEAHRDALERHMDSLRRSRLVDVWHDRMLAAGEDWASETLRQLERADLILLLVSADYMASDAARRELGLSLARQRQGAARVVPIIVRPIDLTGSSIGRLHWLPHGGKPISTWASRDEAWVSVVQELRNVIDYSVTRSGPIPPATAEEATISMTSPALGGAPRPPSEPQKPVLLLGDIFRRGRQPDITFVEPSQLRVLKVYLSTMGQGLVVEGPSGIGKTTAANKAREAVAPSALHIQVRSLVQRDLEKLDHALLEGFVGHLFVDDFHHLDDARKRGVANAIKAISDENRGDAKITVIGVNPVGVSLVRDFPDLAGRFDVVSMKRQPHERIAELISRGEEAANVCFLRRDEFINAAAGSLFTAQQLCFHACVNAGVDATQGTPTPTPIDLGVRDVLDAVMASLDSKYRDPLRDFSAWDRVCPRPGACLALLWLLSRDAEGFISIAEAGHQFPALADTFAWLGAGNLERAFGCIDQLSKLFYYNALASVLTAEDPQLAFYLQHVNWLAFARKSGHAQVRLTLDGALVMS